MESFVNHSDKAMDLRCRSRFDGAFYHVLHDCILPNVCHIQTLREQRLPEACTNPWLTHWLHLLVPNLTIVETCTQRPHDNPCPTDATLKSMLPIRAVPSTTVVLQRRNTRTFDAPTFDALVRSLGALGEVVVYTGAESPLETVRVFQRARYLVGYHGAGLVNAYFMHNATRILEISTFTDLNNTRPWRSNMKEVTKYGDFRTRILRLPIQQILHGAAYRHNDTDHFIKDLKYVPLTRHDIEGIVRFGTSK